MLIGRSGPSRVEGRGDRHLRESTRNPGGTFRACASDIEALAAAAFGSADIGPERGGFLQMVAVRWPDGLTFSHELPKHISHV